MYILGAVQREYDMNTAEAGPAAAMNFESMRQHAGDAAQLLKALANENRLMLLCTLSEGEQSVGQLNERIALSQSALSQHLAVLRRDGLVMTRRESQTIYYSLADGPAAKVIELLHDMYCGDG